MTNAQISCFMAVARYRSFSRAAGHLYISQSGVSKQVSQLEKDLGFSLMDRAGGTVRLTPAGERMYGFFDRTLNEFDALLEEIRQMSSGHEGDVRLGCLDGWDLSQFYPELRALFQEKYPHITLRLEGYDHIHVLDALLQGEIDVAITLGLTLPQQARLSRREIAAAPAVILLSAQHPLAGKEDLALRDLRDEPFYVVAPSSEEPNPMERLTLELCRQAGFEPRIMRAANSAVILMRLQSGSGAQITCEWTCACRMPTYRSIPLRRALSVSAAWMEDGRRPAKHIFLNELFHFQGEFTQT